MTEESKQATPTVDLLMHQVSEPIQEIAQLGLMVYTREGFDLFMTPPMAVFDHHMALQLIEIGRGDGVFSAFAADDEGMGVR